MNSNHNLLINTLAGTILSVSYLPAVQEGIVADDIIKSAILAAVGATVSLIVSLLLRHLSKKISKKFRR